MHGPSLLPAEDRALPEGKILPEYFKVSILHSFETFANLNNIIQQIKNREIEQVNKITEIVVIVIIFSQTIP